MNGHWTMALHKLLNFWRVVSGLVASAFDIRFAYARFNPDRGYYWLLRIHQ